MNNKKSFGLSRFQLKTIALICMVLDNAYLRFPGMHGVIHLVTRFVSPLFAWLMVDGFFHTRSRIKYFERLWIAAAVMQVGNVLSHAIWGYRGIDDNIFLTLALGFSIIWLLEKARETDGKKKVTLYILGVLLALGSVVLSCRAIPLPFGNMLFVEGGIELIPWILISYLFNKKRDKQAIILVLYNVLLFFLYGGVSMFEEGFGMFCFNSDWMSFLVLPFIFLYNGEEGHKSKAGKWFFYAFYPFHLWILALLGNSFCF